MIRHAEPIPLVFTPLTTSVTTTDGKINLAKHAAADVGFFTVPFKCEVLEAGLVVRIAFVGASIADANVKFDKRPTAGSATLRGDGDIADFKLGVTGGSALGDVMYDLVGQGTTLEPGQEVVVEVVTGIATNASTGSVWPYLTVAHLPEVRDNLSHMTETT
jgi:hypothetical protein